MKSEYALLWQNRQAWGRLVADGNRFTQVATEEVFADSLRVSLVE